MRVLICGGRNYQDKEKVNETLLDISGLREQYKHGTIIHGNAKGADTLGALWGYNMGWKVEAYPADWKKYGIGAGYFRNKQMLEEGKPDLVVVFPGGRGTANMVALARDAKVSVKEIQ